jgi:hypothetical protein
VFVSDDKKQKKLTRRTKRPFGTHYADFPRSKRERFGDPDYYHKLNEQELDFIAKFNEEYVNGSFVAKRGDDYCEEDLFSWREDRNAVEREQGAAKRDLLSYARTVKKVAPTVVTELAFAYANYLYAVTGDESFLIREHTDLNAYSEDEGWEKY